MNLPVIPIVKPPHDKDIGNHQDSDSDAEDQGHDALRREDFGGLSTCGKQEWAMCNANLALTKRRSSLIVAAKSETCNVSSDWNTITR